MPRARSLLLATALGACGSEPAQTPPPGCGLPACLTDVIGDCVESESCMSQSIGTTGINICYSNGVKMSSRITGSRGASITSYTKRDGKTPCWSQEIPVSDGAPPTTLTVTYRDGAGRDVATGTFDTKTNQFSIACAGGAPQTVPPLCLARGGGGSGSDQCTKGSCP